MNKDNILYGIIGLLVGVMLGYIITNSINRNTPTVAPTATPLGAAAGGSGALPADHPPLDGTGGEGQADVMAVIEKARREVTNFEAQMEAASLYYQIKRYDQVLEFLKRAYQIRPDDFAVLANLGNVTFDLQRYEEAEQWYQRALKVRPDSPNVHADLGLTYYLRTPRDLDKAIAAFRAALSYDPRHEQALQNLTSALIEKNDKAAAREMLARLEQVNPNNESLTRLRAQLAP